MRVASIAAGIVACLMMMAPAPALADNKDVVHETAPGEFEGRIITASDKALGNHRKRSGGTAASSRERALTKIVLKKTNNNQRKAAIEVMCREARTANIPCTNTRDCCTCR